MKLPCFQIVSRCGWAIDVANVGYPSLKWLGCSIPRHIGYILRQIPNK